MRTICLRILGIGICLCFSESTYAWSRHTHITRQALVTNVELSSRRVEVTSLESCLKDLTWRTVALKDLSNFNKVIEIHHAYVFSFKLGEKIGSQISALDVISHYSDEPDWGMDKELFEDGQYPHLWKDEYTMMGGRKGDSSQAFRHMFWPKFSWKHPFKTFKLPFSKINQSMGVAPERAQMFFELAQEAHKAGHKYWAWRFLANGFHYIEDVAQPFHSAQTPTKKFILMPFSNERGEGLTHFVSQMTQIVSYYHLAFEEYIGWLLDQSSGDGNQKEGEFLEAALKNPGEFAGQFQGRESNLGVMTETLASISMELSDQAGRFSLQFFPILEGKFAEWVPFKVVERENKIWWDEVIKKGEVDDPTKMDYFAIVRQMFAPMGEAIRAGASSFIESPQP